MKKSYLSEKCLKARIAHPLSIPLLKYQKKMSSQIFLKYDFVKKHAFLTFFSLNANFRKFDCANQNKNFCVYLFDRLLCFLEFLGFLLDSFVRTNFLLLVYFQKKISQAQAKFRTEMLPKIREFSKVFPSILWSSYPILECFQAFFMEIEFFQWNCDILKSLGRLLP